jgi:hypothetical protein
VVERIAETGLDEENMAEYVTKDKEDAGEATTSRKWRFWA